MPIVNTMRNLADLNSLELKGFLDSFDNVLCDCDGVLMQLFGPIADVDKPVAKLQKLGKRVGLVTDNSSRRVEEFQKEFKRLNIEVGIDDIVYPTLSIINYLKSINFQKEVYVLGFPAMREELVEAGFKLADPGVRIGGNELNP